MATVQMKKNSLHRFEILLSGESKSITLGSNKASAPLWIRDLRNAIEKCIEPAAPPTPELLKTLARKPSDPLLKDFIELLEGTNTSEISLKFLQVPQLPERLRKIISHNIPTSKKIEFEDSTLIAKAGNTEGILELATSTVYCKRGIHRLYSCSKNRSTFGQCDYVYISIFYYTVSYDRLLDEKVYVFTSRCTEINYSQFTLYVARVFSNRLFDRSRSNERYVLFIDQF